MIASLLKTIRNFPLPVVALILFAVVAQVVDEAGAHWLRYDRQAIADGQMWRLVSGHLVHLSWMHLLMNLAALLIVTLGFGARLFQSWGKVFGIFVLLCLAISAGFWLRNPELEWYVGLSGVLHGLVALIAAHLWPRERTAALLLAAGLIIKVSWEQLTGPNTDLAATIGGAVVVDAHLYGLVAGAALALLMLAARRHRMS